ncbi:hypothetical protein JYK00_01160 [Thermosipho ferrireducens]|uniref:Abortive infection protein n=1 Tax=Thermosipho ferrireducens TaxID=2571116 RepID=A0ABX7S6I0_9BACT|nr:hypothetical protein [Thermosipho ferrireducens]QTA38179.1 hypothetical protein JYK00_01160 [Thermosipho ferrireducens]
MSDKKLLNSLVFFYILVYTISYVAVPAFHKFFKPKTISGTLLLNSVVLLMMFAVIYTIIKINKNDKTFFATLGIRKKNTFSSFLLAEAFSIPILLSWLIGVKVAGINAMLVAAKPSWINMEDVSFQSLFFAIILWTLTGIISFSFWQAFPYELMNSFPLKLKLTLIVILWSGLYNAPLLSGKFDLFDIVFFGLLFTIVYHKRKNSIGILIAYLLNENPLWWIIAALFKPNIENVFLILLIFRALISFVSIILMIRLKKTASII